MFSWLSFVNRGDSNKMWDSLLTAGAVVNREGLGSESETMAELAALLKTDIPEGRNNLADSHTNLERVAEYCENNYFQADDKRMALEETKNYTTQSLASVAYQINTLAYNFLQLLDLQTAQMGEMESQMNHIAQTVMIHKEKVARREIGVLTANKSTNRTYKIIAPANPEKPIKYVRRAIDYNALDDIGHGVRTLSGSMRGKQRGSSAGSLQAMVPLSVNVGPNVGPAPTTKPPTPPQAVRSGMGTLSKGSREYRTPPAVAPPQVPSHYAPNYPLGHPRRDRGPGYSSLPMHSHTLPHQHHGSHHGMHANNHAHNTGTLSHHPHQQRSEQAQQQLQQQMQQMQQIQQQQQQALQQQQQQQLQQQQMQQQQQQQQPPPPQPPAPLLQIAHQEPPHPPASLPQVGLVHPIPQTPPPNTPPATYSSDHHMSMPRQPLKSALKNPQGGQPLKSALKNSGAPPSPLVLNNQLGSALAAVPTGMLGHNTLPHQHHGHYGSHQMMGGHSQHYRLGSQTPPPPPQPEEAEHARFGQPRGLIVPEQMDLPGWVPKNYMEKVVAIYDYYADKDDELSFQESAVIYVLKKNDDGWWEGVMDGITGLFPGNYVEPCV